MGTVSLPLRRKRQAAFSSHTSDNATRVSALGWLARAAAVTLIGASAAFNANFAASQVEHEFLAPVAMAAAGACSLLQAAAPLAIRDALRSNHVIAGMVASLLLVVCMAFSLTSALGSASSGRDKIVAERVEITDAHRLASDTYLRAENQLTTLPSARPVSVLEALPHGVEPRAWTRTNGCTDATTAASIDMCTEYVARQTELATARERARLEGVMEEAGKGLAKSGAVRAADPTATNIVSLLGLAGIAVKPEVVSPVLALVWPLVLELGAVLGLLVADGLRVPVPSGRIGVVRADSEVSHGTEFYRSMSFAGQPIGTEAKSLDGKVSHGCPGLVAQGPEPDGGARDDGSAGHDEDGPGHGARVVDFLRARGGRIEGGQRAMADAIGLSKSVLNRALHELASAGAIVVKASKAGTVVRLAA